MYENYKQLMQQQYPTEDASVFFEKKDASLRKPMALYKKILIAAACLCLLIPSTVLAVENIFDISIVRIGPRKDLEGNDVIGYNIDFVTTKEIPLEEIGEKWRYPEEFAAARYESWQELQADLGYNLLDNSILEQEYDVARSCRTFDMTFRDQSVPCTIFFRAHEGQLYSFEADASYRKGDLKVFVNTSALVEHPNIPEDVKSVVTAVQYLLDDEADLEHFSTEEYVAANGLTATILRTSYTDTYVFYDAFFRANGVRYTVSMSGVRNAEQTIREELIRILEAFTME